MKKFGFKVQLNNKTICRAGYPSQHAIVSCILNSVRRKLAPQEDLSLSVTGLDSSTGAHGNWFTGSLQEGDIITIEVVSQAFDTPQTTGSKRTEKELLEQKLHTYRHLQEELKDYLKE